jgi:DNA invertase Pin-like site-specific DNA recombinase
MAVYGYARVSTDRQADEGESLGVQERRIRGQAMADGFEIEDFYVERGVSGSVPWRERPEGSRLFGALKPGDQVIVASLDRAFRSALDGLDTIEDFRRRGIGCRLLNISNDDIADPNGRGMLVYTILLAVAQEERRLIRERVRGVKRDQAERGRYLGGFVPLGWRIADGGALEEDPAGQAALQTIRRRRADGASLRTIAEDVQRAHGVKISHQGVADILSGANGAPRVAA